jgi:hypothetical protein
MENVVLNGFDDKQPGNIRSIIARLADCGSSKWRFLLASASIYSLSHVRSYDLLTLTNNSRQAF